MKNLLILVALTFVGVVAWRLSDTISRDAVIMGVGFLFGALAGVPAALLVVASQRRREQPEYSPRYNDGYSVRPQQQPPVIVLGAGNPHQQGQHYPAPYQAQQQPAQHWPTGGGSFHLLGTGQDGRYAADDDAWGGR